MVTTRECAKGAKAEPKGGGHPYLHTSPYHLFLEASKDCLQKCERDLFLSFSLVLDSFLWFICFDINRSNLAR